MERRTERQLVCGKRKCRSTLKGGAGRFRYPTANHGIRTLKKAANTGLKTRGNGDPPPRRPFTLADALKYARGIVAPSHVIAAEIGRTAQPHVAKAPVPWPSRAHVVPPRRDARERRTRRRAAS